MKIKQALAFAREKLLSCGVENAVLDARILLSSALRIKKDSLIIKQDSDIDDKSLEKFQGLLERRCHHEPIANIIGIKPFWKYDFFVNEHVLNPRPDSETLLEAVLELRKDKKSVNNILELGVGSGCLLISLLKEYSSAKGFGVDVSNEALNVAKRNSENLGVKERSKFLLSDWFEKIPNDKKFDLIISNPPYIPTEDIEGLKEEVKFYDPMLALDGGLDGLIAYRIIAEKAKDFLKDDGLVVLEIGHDQEDNVAQIFKQKGFELVLAKKDLARIVRCLCFEISNSN